MPPTRTIPPAKALKTERTHEENQERYLSLPILICRGSLLCLAHTSRPHEEAIAAWKLVLNQREEHQRYTNDALADRYE